MVKRVDPEYYIELCARRYAGLTKRIAAGPSADDILQFKGTLAVIKEAALAEAEAERRRRQRKLSDDLRRAVERGSTLTMPLTREQALDVLDFYAVPPAGTLGLLSSAQLEHLADLFEGWACTPKLGEHEALRLNGMALGSRRMAGYLGPDHEPHDPPDSLLRFLYEKSQSGC